MRIKGLSLTASAIALCLSGAVFASAPNDTVFYTASISADGKIQAQSPDWLAGVKHFATPDYPANYELKYKDGTYAQAPRFCSVSLTDTASSEDLFFGQARLGAAPKATHVTVVTQRVGQQGPGGDGSQAFMLMCVK